MQHHRHRRCEQINVSSFLTRLSLVIIKNKSSDYGHVRLIDPFPFHIENTICVTFQHLTSRFPSLLIRIPFSFRFPKCPSPPLCNSQFRSNRNAIRINIPLSACLWCLSSIPPSSHFCLCLHFPCFPCFMPATPFPLRPSSSFPVLSTFTFISRRFLFLQLPPAATCLSAYSCIFLSLSLYYYYAPYVSPLPLPRPLALPSSVAEFNIHKIPYAKANYTPSLVEVEIEASS